MSRRLSLALWRPGVAIPQPFRRPRSPLHDNLDQLRLTTGVSFGIDHDEFADYSMPVELELLPRGYSVYRWHCASLSSMLEYLFAQFDVHGVIEGDTIVIHPGPWPGDALALETSRHD